MRHWAERFVGEPYQDGANDCASFAERVQREIFQRAINLPTDRAAGVRGQSAQILNARGDYGIPTEHPQEGDAVLMRGRGRLNHLGIYCEIEGVPFVLHAMRNARQVCLHRLRDLNQLGLTVEGVYTWITP